MDTISASPGRTSSKVFSLFGIALSAVSAFWFVAMTIEAARADTPPQPAAKVAYADLDLSTADGAHALLHRIQQAARGVCGPEPVHSPLAPRAGAYYRGCVAASVDAAVARVGSPVLLALSKDSQSTSSVALAAR